MNIFLITYFLLYFLWYWLPDIPYPDPPVVMGAYNYDIPYPDPPVVGAYNYPLSTAVKKKPLTTNEYFSNYLLLDVPPMLAAT